MILRGVEVSTTLGSGWVLFSTIRGSGWPRLKMRYSRYSMTEPTRKNGA